jgi:hypothetical protein
MTTRITPASGPFAGLRSVSLLRSWVGEGLEWSRVVVRAGSLGAVDGLGWVRSERGSVGV